MQRTWHWPAIDVTCVRGRTLQESTLVAVRSCRYFTLVETVGLSTLYSGVRIQALTAIGRTTALVLGMNEARRLDLRAELLTRVN
jgi:hypothetical protein